MGCKGCGVELPPARTKPRTWCSESCRVRTFRAQRPDYVAANTARTAERHRETYVPIEHTQACAICGEDFTTKRPAIYCSIRCAARAQNDRRKADGTLAAYRAANRDRDRERLREYRRRVGSFRARYPEIHAAADARRRQLLAGAERIPPLEVYERDDWSCGICHTDIDPALTWPDPGSASLDHIVPLAKGGTHTRENLQAAHLLCNQQKGAKALLRTA